MHLQDSAPSGRWAVIWRWLKHSEWALHVTEPTRDWAWAATWPSCCEMITPSLCFLICKDPAAQIDLLHGNQYSVTDCSRKSSDIEAEEMKNMNQSSLCPQRVYVQVRGQGPKQRLAIPWVTTSSAVCWVLEKQRWWGVPQPGKQMSLSRWLRAGRRGHTGMLGAAGGPKPA